MLDTKQRALLQEWTCFYNFQKKCSELGGLWCCLCFEIGCCCKTTTDNISRASCLFRFSRKQTSNLVGTSWAPKGASSLIPKTPTPVFCVCCWHKMLNYGLFPLERGGFMEMLSLWQGCFHDCSSCCCCKEFLCLLLLLLLVVDHRIFVSSCWGMVASWDLVILHRYSCCDGCVSGRWLCFGFISLVLMVSSCFRCSLCCCWYFRSRQFWLPSFVTLGLFVTWLTVSGSTPTPWSDPFRDHGLRPWSPSPSEHRKP